MAISSCKAICSPKLLALWSSASTSLFSPSAFSESESALSERSSIESSSNYNERRLCQAKMFTEYRKNI